MYYKIDFVLLTAVLRYHDVIHFFFYNDIGVKHPGGGRPPTCNPGCGLLLQRAARKKFCIYKIGISLLTNRDFPFHMSILLTIFAVEKERDTNCLTL